MKKVILMMCLLLLIAWKYSGNSQVIIVDITDGVITMGNGSAWMVFEEDLYRAKEWRVGDFVKLIYSRGFFMYDYLALNLYLNDVIHLRCVNDGR
jgi:hypothetical protein